MRSNRAAGSPNRTVYSLNRAVNSPMAPIFRFVEVAFFTTDLSYLALILLIIESYSQNFNRTCKSLACLFCLSRL